MNEKELYELMKKSGYEKTISELEAKLEAQGKVIRDILRMISKIETLNKRRSKWI